LCSGLQFWKLIKKIKLGFGKITKDNNNGYFIRMQQKGGKVKRKAINVESRLTLENTEYEYVPSVWADEKKKIVNIGEYEDLSY
jgi:phage gp16-like protein